MREEDAPHRFESYQGDSEPQGQEEAPPRKDLIHCAALIIQDKARSNESKLNQTVICIILILLLV